MKRICSIKHIWFSVLAAIVLSLHTACTLERSNNGKLDGMWHLVEVDTLSTGAVANKSDAQIFWSFQHDLMTVTDATIFDHFYIVMNFKFVDGKLALSTPHFANREEGDPEVQYVSVMQPYGINSLAEVFSIESLSSSYMVLSSDMLRLKFRKF